MITLRSAQAEDAAAIAGIYAPYVRATGVAPDSEPPTARTMRARMAQSDGLYPWLVACSGQEGESETVVGFAYAQAFRSRPAYRWTVETAIHLGGEDQTWGADRLLYGALLATLRRQGFAQAISGIALPNDALISLHESVGFRRAGIFREVGYRRGQWVDVGFWQCDLSEARGELPEPRPFAVVGMVRG